MLASKKLNRRDFLRLAGAASAAALVAACAPQPTATPVPQPTEKPAAQATEAPKPTEAPKAAPKVTGKVEMWVQFYTPTDDMVWSEDNPLPHNQVKVLAQEYMDANPGVTIDIIAKPSQVADHEWIVTQQAGGTIPHVVWTHSFWVDSEIDKGWWVALDPYMAEPNPYVAAGQPGSAKWMDQFFEVPTKSKRSPDGKLYVVPIDLVTTFFFYNVDLFAKYGVEAPKTWGDFISVLDKIKTGGGIPYAPLGWYESQIGGMLYNKVSESINPTKDVISLEMAACAIKAGKYRATNPEYAEWMKFVKKLIPYLAPDWADANADFNRKFLNQETAIFEDGTWRFGYLRANSLLKFKWSTFFAPTITTADSTFATGEGANPIGGATAAQWAPTTRGEKEKILPLVIDILRFYTAPQNAGRFISECGAFLPNIKGVDVVQELKDPLKAISEGIGEAGMLVYGDKVDTETREKMTPIWTDWKLGKIELADAQAKLDALMTAYADAAIPKNNWKCS